MIGEKAAPKKLPILRSAVMLLSGLQRCAKSRNAPRSPSSQKLSMQVKVQFKEVWKAENRCSGQSSPFCRAIGVEIICPCLQ